MEYLISLVILGLIAIFLFLDRKNIKREGIIFLRRSYLLIEKIEKFSKKHSKILNLVGIFAVIIGFIVMFYSFYFLFSLLFVKTEVPAVQIVLPSLPGLCQSNFILCVPPIYWILSIFIIAFSHEIMHGLLAAANRIKIKSIGYAFFLILPAFFVEPNEKQLKKAKSLDKLKVYAAGSFGNFLTAIFVFLLIYLIFILLSNFYKPYGLEVEIIPNSSAEKSNLKGIILFVDNREATIKNLVEVLKTKNESDYINITTTEGNYTIKLENRKIGIIIKREIYFSENSFLNNTFIKDLFDYSKNFSLCFLGNSIYCNFVFNSFFVWLIILSIGIGVFNLLPIKPLDGGLMIDELLKIFFPNHHSKISNLISLFGIILILILIFKPYF
ncbi:MAG: site-2 protease family protein [Candidatus Aenigmatarchaeota archaeon]